MYPSGHRFTQLGGTAISSIEYDVLPYKALSVSQAMPLFVILYVMFPAGLSLTLVKTGLKKVSLKTELAIRPQG